MTKKETNERDKINIVNPSIKSDSFSKVKEKTKQRGNKKT